MLPSPRGLCKVFNPRSTSDAPSSSQPGPFLSLKYRPLAKAASCVSLAPMPGRPTPFFPIRFLQPSHHSGDFRRPVLHTWMFPPVLPVSLDVQKTVFTRLLFTIIRTVKTSCCYRAPVSISTTSVQPFLALETPPETTSGPPPRPWILGPFLMAATTIRETPLRTSPPPFTNAALILNDWPWSDILGHSFIPANAPADACSKILPSCRRSRKDPIWPYPSASVVRPSRLIG